MTGIDLGDFRVLQNEAHPVFQIGQLGAASLEAPTGHLTVEVNGEESQFDLEALAREHRGKPALRSFATLPCNLEGLIPVSSKGAPDDSLRLRGSHRFLQYGKRGEEMEVLFTIPVLMPTWKTNLRVPIFLRDSKGNLVDSFQMNGERSLPYRFTPQADGVYQFEFENWNSMNVRSEAPGQGYDASRRLGLLGDGKWRSLYFWVPAGLEEVSIEVWGDVEEPVQAKLVDAEGSLAGELGYEFGTRLLTARRPAGGAEELWRLDIRGFQDYAIRLGRPLPPFIFILGKHLVIWGKRWGNIWVNFLLILRQFAPICTSAHFFVYPRKTAHPPPFHNFPHFYIVELEGIEQEKRNADN